MIITIGEYIDYEGMQETEVDLDRMETIVKVNGKESNRFRTSDMIFA